MDDLTEWMESFGWKPVEDLFGEIVGYRYSDRCYMEHDMAEAYWFIREACPDGPPKF